MGVKNMDRNWCGSKISRYNRFKIEKVCFELLNRLEDIEALKNGAQIVVGTPGRLVDLIKRKALICGNYPFFK